MAEFPKVGSRAVAQYPSLRVAESSTLVLQYLDGSSQRFRTRAAPGIKWVIRLADVATEERFAIEKFFLDHQGRFGSFSFTDPWDGTEYPDCSFENDEFVAAAIAAGRSAATLTIVNNQV